MQRPRTTKFPARGENSPMLGSAGRSSKGVKCIDFVAPLATSNEGEYVWFSGTFEKFINEKVGFPFQEINQR